MANSKNYKCLPYIFALALSVSEIEKLKMFDLQKRHAVHFTISSFDDKISQNLQTSFFTCLIFAKVWPVRKKVPDTQTNTQTHRHRNGQSLGHRRNLTDLPKNQGIKSRRGVRVQVVVVSSNVMPLQQFLP